MLIRPLFKFSSNLFCVWKTRYWKSIANSCGLAQYKAKRFLPSRQICKGSHNVSTFLHFRNSFNKVDFRLATGPSIDILIVGAIDWPFTSRIAVYTLQVNLQSRLATSSTAEALLTRPTCSPSMSFHESRSAAADQTATIQSSGYLLSFW